MKIDLSKVDNIVFEGIDTKDYPDFCDTYIAEADYDGRDMTEEELEELNEDYDFVYEKLMDHIF